MQEVKRSTEVMRKWVFQQEDQLRVLVSAPAADEPTVGGEKSFFSFRIFTGEYAIILNTLFKALLTLLDLGSIS